MAWGKVNYNETTGEINGYFANEIKYKSIPEPNIEIDEATWLDCINHPGRRRVDVTAGCIVEYTPTGPTQEELRQAQLDALDAEYAPQRKQLWDYLGLAVNYWRSTEAADSIRLELDNLESEYNAKAEAIWNG